MQKNAGWFLFITTVALLFVFFLVVSAGAAVYENPNESEVPEYLYYIEGTGSYYLPGNDGDIFFNLRKWYRHSGGSWSMSDDLEGPWSGITTDSLPEDLAQLPADFKETRKLGMMPYRYVAGPERRDDDYPHLYYRGRYYDDYERHGYRKRWHPHGRFWFFVAPDFHDDDWDDSHRRRRKRGRY